MKPLNYQIHGESSFYDLRADKSEKPVAVPLAHTIAEPGTVMIIGGDTLVTLFAVFGAEWLLLLTNGAKSMLDEEYYRVIIIFWLIAGILIRFRHIFILVLCLF